VILENVYRSATVVDSGRYLTTVNELCDQLPALRPDLLRHVVSRLLSKVQLDGCTKILVEEEKGATIGTAVSLATGIPLAMARVYPYEMPGHRVSFTAEYAAGDLYVNGIEPGDRVLVVDDTLSTGGTLVSVIKAVSHLGAEIHDIVVVAEKRGNGGRAKVLRETGHSVQSVIEIDVAAAGVAVRPAADAQPPMDSTTDPADAALDFLDLLAPTGEPGMLIVVEGTDGAGKTTLLERLAARLSDAGTDLVRTFQPTPSARATDVFRRFGETTSPDPDLYRALYLVTLGDRLYHAHTVILPALRDGRTVLCDRYLYTTVANVVARGQRVEPWFRSVAAQLPRPDAAFLVHSPVDVAVNRVRQRPDERDRPIDVPHLTAVYHAFHRIAARGHLTALDTSVLSVDETVEAAASQLERIATGRAERVAR
jgi:adenine phosphoribosyltransferase